MKEFYEFVGKPVLGLIAILSIIIFMIVSSCYMMRNYDLEVHRLKFAHQAYVTNVESDREVKINEQRCKSMEYCFDAVASIFGK